MPSLGDLGGGLTGAAGGLAGLGKQLVDAFGGLPHRPDDSLPDPPELKEESGDDESAPDDEESQEDPEEDPENETAAKKDDLGETEEPAIEPGDSCEEEPADEPQPPEPAPTPPPLPPPPGPVEPPPPNPEAIAAETPCEIAADQLPQAGP